MSGGRRADLDWVRVGAFGLLILYHVGMAFVTWDWHVKTLHPTSALEPFMVVLNPWRLLLLFFVSGCATAFMAARMQAGALVRLRLVRLGVPLLFGVLVVVPPQSWVQVREHGYTLGYWPFYAKYLTAYRGFCDAHGCLTVPTWNHLWFVAYLLVYTLLLAIGLAVFRRAPTQAFKLPAWLRDAILLTGPMAWLVVCSVVLRHRFPETHALVNDWYAHAIYAPAFLLGFCVARWAGFWHAVLRLRYVAAAAGGTAYAYIAWLYVAYPGDAVPPDSAIMLYRYDYGIDQWAWMLAILGFAHRYLHRGGPVLAYLTQGVFPFYIVHQTIIVLLEYWLKRQGLGAPAEGVALVAATAIGCWATYEGVRRARWLRPLFGLRPLSAEPPAETRTLAISY